MVNNGEHTHKSSKRNHDGESPMHGTFSSMNSKNCPADGNKSC